MEQLMDLLKANGFEFSEHGVDVVRITLNDISFVGYGMKKGNLSIVVGNKYAYIKSPDENESRLFTSEQFDIVCPYLESISASK